MKETEPTLIASNRKIFHFQPKPQEAVSPARSHATEPCDVTGPSSQVHERDGNRVSVQTLTPGSDAEPPLIWSRVESGITSFHLIG